MDRGLIRFRRLRSGCGDESDEEGTAGLEKDGIRHGKPSILLVAGWLAKVDALGIFGGILVGAPLIVAQGLGSGWNQIDWWARALSFAS